MTAIARVCETVSDALAGAGRVHNRVRMIGTARGAEAVTLRPRRSFAVAPKASGAPADNSTVSFTFPSCPVPSEIWTRDRAVQMSSNNKRQPE